MVNLLKFGQFYISELKESYEFYGYGNNWEKFKVVT